MKDKDPVMPKAGWKEGSERKSASGREYDVHKSSKAG